MPLAFVLELLWRVLSEVLTFLRECHRGSFCNRLGKKRLSFKKCPLPFVQGDSMNNCVV